MRGSKAADADQLGQRIGPKAPKQKRDRRQVARDATTRRIADIRIGERHRRDLGDVDALAASIAAVGLMHPIVVMPDGTLIAGRRRLEAPLGTALDLIADEDGAP